MSYTASYDPAKVELTIENAGTISANISSITESVSSQIGSLDVRIFDYFSDFNTTKLSSISLGNETSTVDTFKSWMSDTYTDFGITDDRTRQDAGKISESDLGGGDETQLRVDTSLGAGTPTYTISAASWDKLPTEDKKAVEAKLKELGFTEEEIQNIKNGGASVNKTTLDKLDSALTKLNSDGSDVRDVILQQYGFDVFNDDGTINRDKLALALVIDGKDPNDQYDLVALLKNKYGIDLFPEGTTAAGGTVPGVVDGTNTAIDGTGTSSVHTGAGYNGSGLGAEGGAGAELDTSEIDNMLAESGENSLLDGLGNLSGSLLGNGNGFNLRTTGEGGNGAAFGLAAGAGLAGLGLAATAGLLAKKKREKELVDGEDDDFDDDDDDFGDDEFDEDFDLTIDEEDIIGDNSNNKSSLLGSAANSENASSAELNKAAEDIDTTNKKKQWLYGLGIGLAGAGLTAGLIAKDEDEDEDDDDQE